MMTKKYDVKELPTLIHDSSKYKDYVIDCMNPRYGEIIITLPEGGFSAHHMASTRLYTSNRTGKIVMAKIFILPKND